MVREELAEAASRLERAAEGAAEEAAERLRTQAEQLQGLADDDSGPDHGRLARHQNALREVREDVDEAVGELIEEANEKIDEFRSRLEGV